MRGHGDHALFADGEADDAEDAGFEAESVGVEFDDCRRAKESDRGDDGF